MYFPILIPNSIKGNNQAPAISTLEKYISIDSSDFFNKLMKICNGSGLSTTLDYAQKWQNFDFLKEEVKIRFVKEIEEPEYFTFKAWIKRIIKK